MTRELAVSAFSALAVLAVAGWTRSQPVTPAALEQPFGSAVSQQLPAGYVPAAVPAYWRQEAYPAAPQTARTPQFRSVPVRAVNSGSRVARVSSGEYVPARTVVRKERPLSHSVAIVAGGAGAGAAIGALAGGGKGAAIGALSGGSAGLIYDRLTHKRRLE